MATTTTSTSKAPMAEINGGVPLSGYGKEPELPAYDEATGPVLRFDQDAEESKQDPVDYDSAEKTPVGDGKVIPDTHSHSDSASDTFEPGNAAPMAKLRVEKGHAFGLLLPQNQSYIFHTVDLASDENRGPAFGTSSMKYVEVLSGLPPSFELYTTKPSLSGQPAGSKQQVSRAIPKGWQGMTSCRAEMEVEAPLQGGLQKGKWLMERTGGLRSYNYKLVEGAGMPEFSWKGASKAVRDMRKQAREGGKKSAERVHKGNLKCVAPDGQLLALWLQTRSMDFLGDLVIFEAATDILTPEVIITSLLLPITAERATGMNWIGGFGK